MGYETWIALGILALILGLAIGYIIKAKKKGQKCIGCPNGGCNTQCKDTCGCCNCHCGDQ